MGFLQGGVTAAMLRERAGQPPFDRLWGYLVERTRTAARRALAADFAPYHGSLGWHTHTPMLPTAALIHAATGDAELLAYLEAAIAFVDRQSREWLAAGKKRAIHSHAEIAIAADLLRDGLPAATETRVRALMREVAIDDHCGDSYRAYGGGNNIRWCHNVQAAICALLWGEASGHPAWRQVVQQGIDHTRCYLRYGCDAAGFSFEGTGYGHGVFGLLFPFVELLALTGTADLYASEPRLRQIATASQLAVFPDASFALNDNDVGLAAGASKPWLLLLAKRFDDAACRAHWQAFQGPDHPTFPYGDAEPWLARAKGQDGPCHDLHLALLLAFLYWEPAAPVTVKAPPPLAHYSPGTEGVNLRTSWSADAIYVNMQGSGRSRMSMTHRHADAGHFSIFAHGEYLAIDTGRYNSDEDQHSVVVIDGKPHVPIAPGWGMDWLSGRVTTYESTPLLTHARIDAAHQKGCHWALRDLLWVPLGGDDAYLVVIDNLNRDNARHAFWWQLQAHPEATIAIDSDWQAQVRRPNARLDLAFAWPGPADFPDQPHRFALRQEVKEWHYPYGRDRDIQAAHRREGLLITSYARPRLIGDLDGLNGHFMAMIVPRRTGAPPLTIRRREQRRLLWMEVETPLGTDTVIAALDHGFVRTERFTCLSELVLLRHDAAGRQTATWTLGGAPQEAR